MMPLFVLGGRSALYVRQVGSALSGHPDLEVRVGAGPSTFCRAIREVVAVRAKDPARPWDPDPEWVGPFAIGQTLRAFPPGATRTLIVDEALTADRSAVDGLARQVFVGPTEPRDGQLVLAEGEVCTDPGIDRLFSFLEIDDRAAVRTALRSVRPPEPPPVAQGEWSTAFDADQVPPSVLSAARVHPHPEVRAALTRWLVKRGLDPEAAELLCGTRLIDWSRGG